MRIRGERECKDCGARWSYYETGSVACPECESLHSVGVDERTQHTNGAADLDLTEVRNAVDADPLPRVADAAKDACRAYVRRRGFIHEGELRRLDDEYLAAAELMHAADLVGRAMQPDDAERLYFVSLVGGADEGDRPDPADVPDSMREARGLAYADAVREYYGELRDWEGTDLDDPARSVLDRMDAHVRRLRGLQGNVDPETAERLVTVARELHAYVTDGDEDALARASDRLDRLDEPESVD
ncbi:MAG: uncharacterized Zn finger protein (UPF0148 family) [Halobacteriales archaeon]|jgi:uncharacterized Zn finger protein (UPF0148 family)